MLVFVCLCVSLSVCVSVRNVPMCLNVRVLLEVGLVYVALPT